MTQIYLVRHGRAAAGFDGHADPGLDDLGRRQAAATATELARFGPLPILSSPLARARETALPLAEHWGSEVLVEPRVAEIPSPTTDLQARTAWLREAMGGRWRDLDAALQRWRQELVQCLLELPGDSVVFCHFIAINVAVGHAGGDDRLVLFAPDNGSVTRLSVAAGRLELVELGRSAQTHVN